MSLFSLSMALVFLAVLLSTIFLEFKVRSPFIVFPVGLVGVFFFPFLILAARYSDYTQAIVASWAVAFAIVYFLSRLFLVAAMRISWRGKINRVSIFVSENHGFFCVALFLILFMALVFSFYQFDFDFYRMLTTSWGERRQESNGTIWTLISQYLVYSASLTILVLYSKFSRSLFLIFIFSVFYYVLIVKTRSFFVALVLPFFVLYFFSGEIRLRKFVFSGLVLGVFIFIFMLTRSFRHAGGLVNVIQNPSYILTSIFGSDLGEFGLLDAFFYFVEYDVKNYNFDNNSGLLRMILMFFPDSLVEGVKPVDVPHSIWDEYTGIRGVGGSYHATVIADSYVNDKSFGFLIYPVFYALLFTFYERMVLSSRLLWLPAFSICCVSVLVIVRGAVYNGVAILIATTFFWILLFYLKRWLWRSEPKGF